MEDGLLSLLVPPYQIDGVVAPRRAAATGAACRRRTAGDGTFFRRRDARRILKLELVPAR